MSGSSRKHLAVAPEILQASLDCWHDCGFSPTRAGQILGLSTATLTRHVRQAKAAGLRPTNMPTYNGPNTPTEYYAAQSGDAPDFDLVHPLPDGLVLKGASTRYDEAGNVTQQWVKSRIAGLDPTDAAYLPDPKRISKLSTFTDAQGRVIGQWVSEKPELAMLDETIKVAVAEYLTGYEPIIVAAGPSKFDTDIIPWFQIGDAHVGMLAHEAETGQNFDLKIAERELCTAFATLFDECPYRERCVINDLGDGTHAENLMAVTEASRHPLDVDGRFPKMIGVYVRTMRFIIERALERFRFVDVIINQGNHSRTNDMWMAELLRQVYADTDRVNILNNSGVFISYRMGNTFVMVHHGDKTKPERLAQVMSNDFRQDWGETEYRYIDVGHLHHKWSSRESAGCTIEMWNTLAAKDRWANDGGYRAHQSITRVDRSRTYGEVGRRVLPIKEIRDVIIRASGGPDHYIPPERRLVFSV
jgi:hypothetical protein